MKQIAIGLLAITAACQPNYQNGKTKCALDYGCPSGFICGSRPADSVDVCFDLGKTNCPVSSKYLCSSGACVARKADCPLPGSGGVIGSNDGGASIDSATGGSGGVAGGNEGGRSAESGGGASGGSGGNGSDARVPDAPDPAPDAPASGAGGSVGGGGTLGAGGGPGTGGGAGPAAGGSSVTGGTPDVGGTTRSGDTNSGGTATGGTNTGGRASGGTNSGGTDGTGTGGAGGTCPGTKCGSACTDLNTDVNNCGTCGRICAKTNAGVLACHAGFCDTTDCTPGWGNCTQPVGVAPDDGCETNLNTSLSNCGDCGTACKALAPSTATCTAGRCLVTLASGQNAPLDIVADGLDVYWTNDSSMNPGGTTTPGSVLMIPVGGGSPSTLASGQESPAGLAVEGSVYWADRLDGTVLKVDLASAGSPTTLASGQNGPQGLAVYASNVYWATVPSSMAPDGTVMKLWGGAGNPVTLASGQQSPGRIALDPAGDVYWTDPSAGTVMKLPFGSSSVTTLASAQNYPLAIAADTTGVYWTNSGAGGGITADGAIMKVDSAGTVTTLASAQYTPNAVAVDATSAYWTEHTGYRVMKAPIGGGTPTTLASGQTYPNGIAVDATSVYWVSGAGTVMKLTRK